MDFYVCNKHMNLNLNIMLKVTKLQTHVAFNQLFELKFVGCEFNLIR